jgi:hydroxymethylbilane synthase
MRLATRTSPLALAQANAVADRVRALGSEVEIIAMRTEGDRRLGARLADVGGKGLFVREIEEALLAGRADVAVHSLKDLPAELPDGLTLVAFPERAEAHDVLGRHAGDAPRGGGGGHLEPAPSRPRPGRSRGPGDRADPR